MIETYKIEIGMVFGRLTIKSYWGIKNKRKHWICLCECGKECVTCGSRLKSGWVKSCGCLNKEKVGAITRSHQLSKTREYSIWHDMMHRCYDAKNKEYMHYGGRGIRVCEEWRADPINFSKWYNVSGYHKGLTLDRIDNNGDYCPENCKWSTSREQSNNKRNNCRITIDGITKNLGQWAEEFGVSTHTIKKKYKDFFEKTKEERKRNAHKSI